MDKCPLCGGRVTYRGLTSLECLGPIATYEDEGQPCPNEARFVTHARAERAKLKLDVQAAFAGWYGVFP